MCVEDLMSQVSEESSREDVEPMGLVSTTHFVSTFIFTLLLMISEPSEHKPSKPVSLVVSALQERGCEALLPNSIKFLV